jgi:spore maturation protein CgeB
MRHRWPDLARKLDDLDPASGGVCLTQGGRRRLLVHGQSLVSSDPRREAERWVDAALAGFRGIAAKADQVPRVHLFGHGVGWEVAALLERGAPEVVVHPAEPAVLRFALEHWECPQALADPRVTFAATRRDCAGLARPGDLALETPLWRRLFAEEVAARRATAGLLRSAELRLRILVVEPLYGGSLPMARSAAAALRALGHDVRSLSFEGMAGARETLHAFSDRHPGAQALAAEFTRLMGRMVLVESRAFGPDLVLGLAQSPFTPEASRELRSAGIRTAFWFVEDWETLDYWRGLHGHFDFFLPIQRGRFQEKLAGLASTPVRYLPACADPDHYRPEEWGEGEPPALSFVGAGYHNRERLFLELLDLPLRIWGSDWRASGPVGRLLQNGGRRTTAAENRRIYANSLINLNLHSSTYHAGINPDGDFVNPRTFEILACGGFQLTDRRSLLPELLEDGRELVCFDSVRQLRELVAHHLAHPAEGRAIAAAGRRAVLELHTYRHRMAELLELVLLEQADVFPHAARRRSLDKDSADPELAAWLAALPPALPRELDAVADWLRRRREPLDAAAATILYMQELRDWARAKGVEQAYEQARLQREGRRAEHG